MLMITASKKLISWPKAEPRKREEINFLHLYWDVVWFGLAFGSTLSFLPIYITRLNATSWQLGLFNAGPALVGILLTLPVGRWLEKRSLGTAVTKTAFWQRILFFCLIPFPLFLPTNLQIWAALGLILLMAIPGTALNVGFNALLAATIPPEARGHVVGRRNSLLAGTIMIAFLINGWILDHLPFEWGYAIIFSLGALGAGLSTYHLSRIQVPTVSHFQIRPLHDQAQPGRAIGISGGTSPRLSVGLRLWLKWRPSLGQSFRSISGQYWRAMGAFFLFQLTYMLPATLFPLYWVHQAALTDGEIGWINGVLYLSMLITALWLGPLTKRWGNYALTVGSALAMALYPLMTALSTSLAFLMITSVIGGLVWAILSGAIINRLLEITPEEHRSGHLALYNLALSVAILLGNLGGPLLGEWLGLSEALILICVLRLGSGLALARWG